MSSKRTKIIVASAIAAVAIISVVLIIVLGKQKSTVDPTDPANPSSSSDVANATEATNPEGPGGEEGAYVVSFALPESATEPDRNSTSLPEQVKVAEGTKIGDLMPASRDRAMFLSWTYDAEGKQRANSEDVITKDLTLYPAFAATNDMMGVKANTYVAKQDVPSDFSIELVSYGLTKEEVMKRLSLVNSSMAGRVVEYNLRSLREEEELKWLQELGLNEETAKAVWALAEKSESDSQKTSAEADENGEAKSLKELLTELSKDKSKSYIDLPEDAINIILNHYGLETYIDKDSQQFLELDDATYELLRTMDIDFTTTTEEELLERYGLSADDSLERVWREEFKLSVDQVLLLEDLLYGKKEIRGDHWILTSAEGAWETGTLYSVGINDTSKLRFVFDGQATAAEVIEYNFTTPVKEVNNITIDSRVIHVPATDVEGVEFRGVLNVETDENGNVKANENTGKGVMTYKGAEKLGVGNVVAVHKGNYDPKTGLKFGEGDVAYVKILEVKDDKTFAYEYAGLENILATENVIPIRDSGSKNGTVTVESAQLDFAKEVYREYGLDATTIIKVGDLIEFYTGSFGGADYKVTGYGKITGIAEDELAANDAKHHTTFTYETVSEDKLSGTEVMLETKLPEVDMVMNELDSKRIEEQMKHQIEESGIVDETTELFMSLLTGNELDFASLEHGDELKNMIIRTNGQDMTLEDIRLLADDASVVTVSDIAFNCTLDYKLSHFKDKKGLRAEAAVTLTISVKIGDAGSLEIQPAIVLEQEVLLTPSVRVKRNVYRGRTSSLYIEAGLDAGTYTGFGVVVTAKTKNAPNPKAGEDWNEMVGNFLDNGDMSSLEARTKAAQVLIKGGDILKKAADKEKNKENGHGWTIPMTGDDDNNGDGSKKPQSQEFTSPGIGGDLPTKYSSMLSNDAKYIKLVDVDLGSFDIPIDPAGIIHVGMKINFNVSMKINAMIGAGVSYENAKHYSYAFLAKIWGGGPELNGNQVGSDPLGSDVKELANEFRADFYAFGMIGLRAGVSLDLRVGIFSTDLDSVGVVASAGAYAELYGFLYVSYVKTGSEPAKSSACGSLYFEMGFYTDISVKVQVAFGAASKSWSLYNSKTPLLKLGCEHFPLDYVISQNDSKLSVEIPDGQNTVKIDDSIFKMKLMALNSGKVSEKNMDSKMVCTEGAQNYTATILTGADGQNTNGLVLATERSWTQNHEENFTVECFDLTGKNGEVVSGASSFQYLPGTNEIYVCPLDSTKNELYGKVVFTYKNHAFGFNTDKMQRTVYVHWKGTKRTARVEYYVQKNYNNGEDIRDWEMVGTGNVSGYDGVRCYVDITPEFCEQTFPGYRLIHLGFPDEAELSRLYDEAAKENDAKYLTYHAKSGIALENPTEANKKAADEAFKAWDLVHTKLLYYSSLYWDYYKSNETAIAQQSGKTYFTLRGNETVIQVHFLKIDVPSLWIALDPATDQVIRCDGEVDKYFNVATRWGNFSTSRFTYMLKNQNMVDYIPDAIKNYRTDDYTLEWYYVNSTDPIYYKHSHNENLCRLAYDTVSKLRNGDLSGLTPVKADTKIDSDVLVIGVLTGKECTLHWMDGENEIDTTTQHIAERIAPTKKTLEKDGCTFVGWVMDDGSEVTGDTRVPGEIYIHATYEGQERKVIWITDAGKRAESTIRVGESIYQNVPEGLAEEGYTLAWRTSKDDLKTELGINALMENKDGLTLYGRKTLGFSTMSWYYGGKEHAVYCEIGTKPVRPELPAKEGLDLVWKLEDGTVMQEDFIMPRSNVRADEWWHEHKWAADAGRSEPTCSTPGRQGKVCTVCGLIDNGTEIPIDPNAHKWVEFVDSESTCATHGIVKRRCDYCGKVDETFERKLDLDPDNHTGNTELRGVVEPNCVGGYSGDVHCKDCGALLETGHDLKPSGKHGTTHLEGVKASSCTEYGYSGDEICDVCGRRVKYGSTIARLPHVGVLDPSREVKATCTTHGKVVWQCENCDYSWEVDLGTIEDRHTWDEGKVISTRSCETDGVVRFTCKECGKTYENVEKKIGSHDFVFDHHEKTPGCLTDGLDIYKCSVCGKTKEEVVKAVGSHSWSDKWELTQEGTCTKPGIRTYTCTVCGEKKEVETEKDPNNHLHYSDFEVVTKPGCETRGRQRRQCTDCKQYFYEDLAPIGHDYGEPTYTWAADNSSVTATRTCKNDKSHVETETVKTTSAVTKPATLDAMGDTTYTATFTNAAFTAQSKTITNIEKLNPNWSEPTYTWSADNSKVTAKRTSRTDPSVFEEETANATANVKSAVTCTTAGETEYTATFKNTAFAKQTKTVTAAALGHDWKLKSSTPAEPVIDSNNVCTDWKTGNKHYECDRCHESKDEVIKVPLAVVNAVGEEEADTIGATLLVVDVETVLKHYGSDNGEPLGLKEYFSGDLSTFGQVAESWSLIYPYTETCQDWYRWWDNEGWTEAQDDLYGALWQYQTEGTYKFKDTKLANSKVADYTGNSVDVVFTFIPKYTDTFETTELTVRFVFKK